DDLHLVNDPATYVALDYLFTHQPPLLRLIIGTRHDPPLSLARLRVRGELAELRAPALRFSLEETRAFLNDSLHLDLATEDLNALQSHTAGWPAALRLLGTSLSATSTAGRSSLLHTTLATRHHLFEFLAAEVLDRQPPQMRAFLLTTSILPELTPALCQAVTGEDATDLLQDVDRRNLFVTTIPDPHTHALAYRYHALFAEFLQRQLALEMPERVPELHRRAAEAQPSAARAIEHYLSAELWDEAATLLERSSDEMLLEQGLTASVEGWLKALPSALLETRPQARLVMGACALQKGALPQAILYLEQATLQLEQGGPALAALLGEAWAILAGCYFLVNDVPHVVEAIERALALPLQPRVHVQVLMARAWLHFYGRDWNAARADVGTALDLAQRSLAAAAPRAAGVLTPLAFYLKSNVALLPGLLPQIEAFCYRALAAFDAQPSPLLLALRELSAFIHLWRGRLEEAAASAQTALDLQARLGGYPFLGLDSRACLAYVHIAAGDYAAAQPLLDYIVSQLETQAMGLAELPCALYLAGANAIRLGDWDAARAAAARMEAQSRPLDAPETPALRLTLRALLAMDERRDDDAENALRQAAALAETTPSVALYSSPALLLAHFYAQRGRHPDALAALRPVLAHVERDACPGLLLKEGPLTVPLLRLAQDRGVYPALAARILALMGNASAAGAAFVPQTGATLTAREMDVLRLLAAGHTNREIAQALGISPTTVKTHVAHLLAKLDATDRAAAVIHARTLRLI
ncbi:MAG: winged helix-turn-helix transcriptional regulator, partial [Anaerolineae bacterium]|nr:winged helix-turn-helix transcriptional regulator [Anaerolineae bacterium]